MKNNNVSFKRRYLTIDGVRKLYYQFFTDKDIEVCGKIIPANHFGGYISKDSEIDSKALIWVAQDCVIENLIVGQATEYTDILIESSAKNLTLSNITNNVHIGSECEISNLYIHEASDVKILSSKLCDVSFTRPFVGKIEITHSKISEAIFSGITRGSLLIHYSEIKKSKFHDIVSDNGMIFENTHIENSDIYSIRKYRFDITNSKIYTTNISSVKYEGSLRITDTNIANSTLNALTECSINNSALVQVLIRDEIHLLNAVLVSSETHNDVTAESVRIIDSELRNSSIKNIKSDDNQIRTTFGNCKLLDTSINLHSNDDAYEIEDITFIGSILNVKKLIGTVSTHRKIYKYRFYDRIATINLDVPLIQYNASGNKIPSSGKLTNSKIYTSPNILKNKNLIILNDADFKVLSNILGGKK